MTISRRSLLAAPLPALAAPCPSSIGFITDAGAPHLSIYLESIRVLNAPSVAVADASGKSFDAAAKQLPGARTYRDPATMLAEAKPTLTVVSMEAHHAPAAIRLALEKGSHVLAEKPACVKLDDFRALVELARRQNRHLMLAFAKRLNPVNRRAKELISSGAIGRPMGVMAFYISDQTRLTKPDYQASWFAKPELALGGHLAWLSIHTLDLIHFVTGQSIRKVTALTTNIGGQPVGIEDSAALSLQLENGALATMHGAYYLDKGNSAGVTVFGSEGWVRFDPDDAKVPLEWYSNKSGKRVEQTVAVVAYHEALKNAQAAACGLAAPFVSAADCLAALRVVYAGYESAKTGRVVELKP